jgi:hypothetical protein
LKAFTAVSAETGWSRDPCSGPGFIVEFVGLPGCGKSVVSHAVAEILRATQPRISERSFAIAHRSGAARRRLTKLGFAGRSILQHPRSVLSLVHEIARSGQGRWLEAVAKTLDLLFVCGLVAHLSRRPGIHVLDQGFFSGLWSVCFRASANVPLERLVEIGTRCCGRSPADLVVVLEVAPATAVERLLGRSGPASRLQRSLENGGATSQLERDLRAAVRSLRKAREALEAPHRAWELHAISNEEAGDAGARAKEIAEWVVRSSGCRGVAQPGS